MRITMFTLSALGLALFVVPGFARAEEADPALHGKLKLAFEQLEALDEQLDDDEVANDTIVASLKAASKLAHDLSLPPEPKKGEDDVLPASWRRKLSRSLGKYHDEVSDLLLEALDTTDIDSDDKNVREPVNIEAGALLGSAAGYLRDTDDQRRLARRVRRRIKRMNNARHDVSPAVLESAFSALAGLNDLRSLSWMIDEHLHTRKQPDDIEQLLAAMRAMLKYTSVPAKQRHELVETMLQRYVAMESLAEDGDTSINAEAAKLFWDKIKTDAIPLIQKYAGYPKAPDGAALASMLEFQDWMRDHDHANREPWTVPWSKTADVRPPTK